MSNVQQRNVNVRQWQCFYGIMTETVSLEEEDNFIIQKQNGLQAPVTEMDCKWSSPSLSRECEWSAVQLYLIVIPSYICNNEYISSVSRGRSRRASHHILGPALLRL